MGRPPSRKTPPASTGQTDMKIDFNNIDRHSVSINDFGLKWRFTGPKYHVQPDIHLEQLIPLDKDAAKFISDFISKTDLHADVPFKKGLFQTIDKVKISANNKQEIKKWLYKRGLPFNKNVYLSWDVRNAMIVPWKIFIKYFDSFYYGGSDDLTVCDESLQWALVLYHEDEIYFGTNKDYKPSDNFADPNFCW